MNNKSNIAKRINEIIKEEIGEFILNEVADFQQLSQLNNTLYTLTNEMSRSISVANLDTNRTQFVNNFKTYCLQIINAIKRCVKKQSINEWNIGGLSSYGINLPPQLGGNISSDYLSGYHWMQNALLNGNNSQKGGNTNTNNGNTVKSVKLLVLLQNLQRWKQNYAQMNINHEIDNQVPQVAQILGDNGVLDKIVQASQ